MRISKPNLVQGEITRYVKSELTGEQILNPDFPLTGVCHNRHSPVPPSVRFFQVSGDVLDEGSEGVYCEYCIEASNHLRRQIENEDDITIDVLGEIERKIKNAWDEYL